MPHSSFWRRDTLTPTRARNMTQAIQAVEQKPLIKIDIGCGKNKRAGFIGVDQYAMDGVDVVMDIDSYPWQWEDGSVEEAHCSHFLEHLNGYARVRFMNELYRVLRVGGKCTLITPHWASNRAYGDFTHQWPPVGEMFFYYLDKNWRATQAPHTDIQFNPDGYNCDFEATWGYSMNPSILARNPEYQQYALMNFKEAAQDIIATLTKR